MISWAIGNGELELGEKQGPAGIEPLGFMEVLEFFVVRDDSEWVVSSLQPVPPFLQSQLDGEQLTISNVIILLRWGQFLRVVSAKLEAGRLTKLLGQHGSDSDGGGIHFHHKWNMGIWMTKDRSRAKGGLKFLKGFVGAGVLGQGLGLSSEHRRQWGSK